MPTMVGEAAVVDANGRECPSKLPNTQIDISYSGHNTKQQDLWS